MERFEIVQATTNDFETLKALMLSALNTDPTAFSSEYLEYINNSNSWWQNYLYPYFSGRGTTMFVSKDSQSINGMIGVIFDTKKRRQHIAAVVWFYVSPEFRKYGLGKQLFAAAINYIKTHQDIKKVTLLVNATQLKALSIYKNAGFEITGTLKQELLINGVFIDEYIMELFL